MSESSITQTPTRYTANPGGREGEKREAGAWGTDPATSLSGAATTALETIKRACIDLRTLVSWQEDPRVLLDLAGAINDAGLDVAGVSDFAGIKANRLQARQS